MPSLLPHPSRRLMPEARANIHECDHLHLSDMHPNHRVDRISSTVQSQSSISIRPFRTVILSITYSNLLQFPDRPLNSLSPSSFLHGLDATDVLRFHSNTHSRIYNRRRVCVPSFSSALSAALHGLGRTLVTPNMSSPPHLSELSLETLVCCYWEELTVPFSPAGTVVDIRPDYVFLRFW